MPFGRPEWRMQAVKSLEKTGSEPSVKQSNLLQNLLATNATRHGKQDLSNPKLCPYFA